MIEVRHASLADFDEILPLARAFHAESPFHRQYPFSVERVRALIDVASFDPDWLAIIAVDGSKIIGLGLFFAGPMFFSDAREAADLTFYVDPKRRGGRAALLMLRVVKQWAIDAEVARLGITVNTGINHDQAGRFFEKHGFELRAQMWIHEPT